MEISTYVESSFFEGARKLVEECGGDFVGIQSPLLLDPFQEHCIIFTKKGSSTLLSIPTGEFTQEAVEEKLGKKVTSVQKMESSIKKLLDEMREEANKIIGMADQLEEELKECLKQRP